MMPERIKNVSAALGLDEIYIDLWRDVDDAGALDIHNKVKRLVGLELYDRNPHCDGAQIKKLADTSSQLGHEGTCLVIYPESGYEWMTLYAIEILKKISENNVSTLGELGRSRLQYRAYQNRN
ncbi:MAG: hypothetical protein HYW23_01715 [Candidatus Aenigmarchaeota archaeon]|nr:hypothetical protein [Candidatus Aenigmarchaeota archaeon]